jgi:hypothetical protein
MKLDRKTKQALEETGLPWSVEDGSKHHKIRLNGKLVGVFPYGKKTEASPCANNNIISNIRRAAREMI